MTLFHSRRDRDGERQVDALLWAWRTSCIGAGLCHVVGTPTGPAESVPPIVDITLGPPLVFLAELLPGQVLADVRAAAHRLAGSLGAVALRVEPHGLRHVRIEALTADPLLGEVARAHPVATARQALMLGRDEQGAPVPLELGTAAHLAFQGSSRSGKSTAVYGVLGQLVDAPDAMVVGSDITGRTLAPWATRPGMAGWHALGTRDPAAHVRVLERLVAEMDRRIEAMPLGCDTTAITSSTPLIVAVLEEFAGLARLLATRDSKQEKHARALLGRLFGESAKAAIRMLLISQRTDATIVGGFERDQCSHGVSFRMASLGALQMLHADVDRSIGAEHATAWPGIALLSGPGEPLRRFRAPHTTYAAYCAEVAATPATGHQDAA